jgi:glycosyltransferase involved in cell wall biosynthesis
MSEAGDACTVEQPAKRMLVLCPHPQGVAAGQRLKFEQYYDDWRKAGWEITVSPFMDLSLWSVLHEPGHGLAKIVGALKGFVRRVGDMFRVRRYDLVYCFMYVTPVGTTLFERLVRKLSRRLIYDIEDNLLVGYGIKIDFPNPLLRLFKGPRKAKYLIRSADHVITSSPFLNDTCMQINRKKACTYVSSSVDTDRFVPVNRFTNERTVTIGWTGTFSTRVYLDLLRPVFQELAKRRTFKLRVIGNFDYALEGVYLEVIRWTAEREVEDLQGIDIGVYPLPLVDWVTGKSGLKAIQYMAFGIPCVATEVGTTPMLIRDGENGLLVRTDDEWLSALERLLDDPALRRRLGEQARKDAVANYSTRVIGDRYREVLEAVMAGGSARIRALPGASGQ